MSRIAYPLITQMGKFKSYQHVGNTRSLEALTPRLTERVRFLCDRICSLVIESGPQWTVPFEPIVRETVVRDLRELVLLWKDVSLISIPAYRGMLMDQASITRCVNDSLCDQAMAQPTTVDDLSFMMAWIWENGGYQVARAQLLELCVNLPSAVATSLGAIIAAIPERSTTTLTALAYLRLGPKNDRVIDAFLRNAVSCKGLDLDNDAARRFANTIMQEGWALTFRKAKRPPLVIVSVECGKHGNIIAGRLREEFSNLLPKDERIILADNPVGYLIADNLQAQLDGFGEAHGCVLLTWGSDPIAPDVVRMADAVYAVNADDQASYILTERVKVRHLNEAGPALPCIAPIPKNGMVPASFIHTPYNIK